MKGIAAEVGLDPFLVERAARLVPAVSRSTLLDHLVGGPLSAGIELHIPARLTKSLGERLLTAARSSVKSFGRGEATDSGASWSSERPGRVFLSAHAEESGTLVRISVDNRLRVVAPIWFGLMGIVFVLYMAADYGGVGVPGLGYAILLGGSAVVLALLRGWLKRTARATLETLDQLGEAIDRTVERDGGDRPTT